MQLAIRMLSSNSSINNLQYLNQVIVNPGSSATVLFQLVDLDQQDPIAKAPGVRYVPAVGASMSLSIVSVNAANNLSKYPTNPFSQDSSIWSFPISSADSSIAAGVNMIITLIQGSQVNIIVANSVLIIGPTSSYSC